MSWREKLEQILSSASVSGGDLVIVGVGNTLRGDDGVGVELARILKESMKSERAKVFIVEDKVDLIPKMLRDVNPGIILLLDAADFGGRPGEIRVMKLEEASRKAISTHELPLDLIMKAAGISAPAYVLGIQVENLEFGKEVSPQVKAAANEVASLLLKLVVSL